MPLHLKSTVIKNAGYLYAVQGINYLFPLITIPYLTRVLGPEEYGLIIYLQTLALTLCIVIEYGFPLSATRELALLKGNIKAQRATIYNTIGAKMLLTIAGSALFGLLLLEDIVPYLREHWGIVLALMVVGGWNFNWFFQGIEKLAYQSIVEAVNKVLLTASIFLFVQQRGDGVLVLQLQFAFSAGTLLLGYYFVARERGIGRFRLRGVWEELKRGYQEFIYRGIASIHSNAPMIVLGIAADPKTVGIYVVAYKFSKQLILTVTGPMWQALYPDLSYSLKEVKEIFKEAKVRLTMKASLAAGTAWVVLLYFGAEIIIDLMGGAEFAESKEVLKVLAFCSPLIMVNIGLMNIFVAKKMAGVVNAALLVNIFVLAGALYYFIMAEGATGAAVATIVADGVLLGSLFGFYLKKK